MNNGIYVIMELKLQNHFLHVTSKQQEICFQKKQKNVSKKWKTQCKIGVQPPPARCVGGVPVACVAAVSAVSDYRPSTLKCQPKTTTTLSQTSRPAFVSSSLLTPRIIGELKKPINILPKKYLTIIFFLGWYSSTRPPFPMNRSEFLVGSSLKGLGHAHMVVW